MRYMLLICTEEAKVSAMGGEDDSPILAEYGKFMEEMERRGVLQGGERLRPVDEAKTVRVRDGKTLTSDGPFAETKEVLGGYFAVDCKDVDEAVEIAAKIPGARLGSIEVRPIWEMNGA
jgi:hypothetical protein